MSAPTHKPKLGGVQNVVHMVSRALAFVAAAVIILMMVATVADVSRRFFLGTPIPGVTEMGEVLMVVSVFLGLAFTESRNAHVNVTLVIDKLPPRLGRALNALGMLLVLIVLAWMVYVTTGRAFDSIETNEYRFGLVQIPVWPGRVAIAIGLAAYFLEALPRLFADIRQLFAKNPTRTNSPEPTHG